MTLSTQRLPAIALRTPSTAADQAEFEARLAQIPDDASYEISSAITRVIQHRAHGLLGALLTRPGCHTQIARRLLNQQQWDWFEAILPHLDPNPDSPWLSQAITTAAEHQQLPWLMDLLPGLAVPSRHWLTVLTRSAEHGRLGPLTFVLDRLDEDTRPSGRTATALAWSSAIQKALTAQQAEAVQVLLTRIPRGNLHRAIHALALSDREEELARVVAQSTTPLLGHIRRTLADTAVGLPTQAHQVADRLALHLPIAEQRQVVAQYPGILLQTVAHLRHIDLAHRSAPATTARRRRT